jgi:hypothetical protein
MAEHTDITFQPLRSVGIDRTGKRFGLWTVLGYAGNLHWWCRCECGLVKKQDIRSLRKGRTFGCMSCRDRDAKSRRWPPRLARIWNGMQQRCYNPKDHSYKNWGGRGIGICDEWRVDFDAFASWACQSGYADDLTIERQDNDVGYSPGNCTWIPHKDQAKNRRILVMLGEGEDRTYTAQFARSKGMPLHLLRGRLRNGWSLDEAVLTPSGSARLRDGWGRYVCAEKSLRATCSASASTPISTPDAEAS